MNTVIEKWDEILNIVKTEHDLSEVSFNTWLQYSFERSLHRIPS